MERKLESLKEKLVKVLEPEGIMVCSVEYASKGKYNFLTVEVDKVNGMDMDSIVLATNLINPVVDEVDITDDSYILDVISKERG